MISDRFSPVLFNYDISSDKSVCGRIWTFGALPHTTLAEWHHRPLGHANGKWMGQGAKRPVDVCPAPTEVERRPRTCGVSVWRIYSPLVYAPLRSLLSMVHWKRHMGIDVAIDNGSPADRESVLERKISPDILRPNPSTLCLRVWVVERAIMLRWCAATYRRFE